MVTVFRITVTNCNRIDLYSMCNYLNINNINAIFCFRKLVTVNLINCNLCKCLAYSCLNELWLQLVTVNLLTVTLVIVSVIMR